MDMTAPVGEPGQSAPLAPEPQRRIKIVTGMNPQIIIQRVDSCQRDVYDLNHLRYNDTPSFDDLMTTVKPLIAPMVMEWDGDHLELYVAA